MITAKCEICHKNSESLFIVSHKEKGRIRICESCLRQQSKSLLAGKSCSCC
jgi:protein-arginine kinase activator protein McsA